jgi:hypothetical protein
MKKTDSKSDKYPIRKYPIIGVCGLDCGLCPRYYTVGSSRCPGCAGPDFFNKHPSCSFITCCVKKRNLEICAECSDFPCSKYKSEEEYQEVNESSSYPSSKKIMPNMRYIKEYGIDKFIEQQKERIELLEKMIDVFNDGRSKSFFCKVTAFFDLESLRNSIDRANQKIKMEKISKTDVKKRAKIFKNILNEIALKKEIKFP